MHPCPNPLKPTFSAMQKDAFRNTDLCIGIRYRIDGSLFSLRRLQAKTKVSTDTVNTLLFADDNCALNVSSEADVQHSVDDKFSDACQCCLRQILQEKEAKPPRQRSRSTRPWCSPPCSVAVSYGRHTKLMPGS